MPQFRSVTILDVARAAEVSKSTVSLALQGSPLLREETTARVLAAAQRLGYVYNRRAAELRRKSSNTIGVVINDLMNPFFAELLVGLERRLVDSGYIALMAHTGEDLDRQAQVLRTMREQHAAGLALCPALGTGDDTLHELKASSIPLVVMVRHFDHGEFDYAGSDNALGSQVATEHLISRGHRRIAFLGGISGAVLNHRIDGYRRALASAGIAFDDTLVLRSRPTWEGGNNSMQTLLSSNPEIRAAVCYNDLVAFGALAALGDRGLRAGHDFDLLGYDNVLGAAHSNPPLSTVAVGPQRLGEAAADLLLQRIAEPTRPTCTYIAQPHLVLRQTG
jgi:LacI family transcriptional regulator